MPPIHNRLWKRNVHSCLHHDKLTAACAARWLECFTCSAQKVRHRNPILHTRGRFGRGPIKNTGEKKILWTPVYPTQSLWQLTCTLNEYWHDISELSSLAWNRGPNPLNYRIKSTSHNLLQYMLLRTGFSTQEVDTSQRHDKLIPVITAAATHKCCQKTHEQQHSCVFTSNVILPSLVAIRHLGISRYILTPR